MWAVHPTVAQERGASQRPSVLPKMKSGSPEIPAPLLCGHRLPSDALRERSWSASAFMKLCSSLELQRWAAFRHAHQLRHKVKVALLVLVVHVAQEPRSLA